MSEASLVAIILGVLTVLGGGGIWTYKASRREEPIRQEEAALAVAKTSQDMALEIATNLRQDVKDLQREMKEEKEKTQTLVIQVEALTTKVNTQANEISFLQRGLRIFNQAWDDLIIRWAVIRLKEEPPNRPDLGEYHGT